MPRHGGDLSEAIPCAWIPLLAGGPAQRPLAERLVGPGCYRPSPAQSRITLSMLVEQDYLSHRRSRSAMNPSGSRYDRGTPARRSWSTIL